MASRTFFEAPETRTRIDKSNTLVVERFTTVDPDTIRYSITMDDPAGILLSGARAEERRNQGR